jgi:biotin carboxyl carrier protein
MNEKNIEPNEAEISETVGENRLIEEKDAVEQAAPKRKQRRLLIAVSALAIVSVVALAAWYWLLPSNGQAGKPVPAPRSMTIDQPTTDTTTGGQTLTIAPEQVERAGIKTETVGEQISSEIGGELATGVVQANAYRETPVVSVVGGIVRRISPELGENVQSGQTVAVVFSDEFAAAQARYVALLTEIDNARKNYERTQKLVRINQPGRTEFDQATAQLSVRWKLSPPRKSNRHAPQDALTRAFRRAMDETISAFP